MDNSNQINNINQINNTIQDNINNEIYFNNVLIKRICIKAKYLNEHIDDYIISYLKNNIEGKCIDEGYVAPDSIKVIKKSIGAILGSRFTGDVTYDIVYTANVCNPVTGNIIDCKVKFINKLGILGTNGPITITIPKQLHKNSDFEHININDNIKIEVIAKKFSLNQKEIKIVAKLWNENQNNNDIETDTKKIKSSITKKKDELISSDLTPILYDNDDYDEVVSNEDEEIIDNENDELSLNETELLDSDDEDINSEDEIEDVKIKMENPDENNLEFDDIDIEENEDEEEDEEEEEDDISMDYN